MPQTKKYLDFVASAPYERGSKHGGPDARRSCVTIACPHCDAAFVEIAADRLHTNKASECLKHLRVCDAAIGAGVLAPPAKRRAGAEEPPPPRAASTPARPRPRARVATGRSGCSHRSTGRLFPCKACCSMRVPMYLLTDA